jgi:hypothetical protein
MASAGPAGKEKVTCTKQVPGRVFRHYHRLGGFESFEEGFGGVPGIPYSIQIRNRFWFPRKARKAGTGPIVYGPPTRKGRGGSREGSRPVALPLPLLANVPPSGTTREGVRGRKDQRTAPKRTPPASYSKSHPCVQQVPPSADGRSLPLSGHEPPPYPGKQRPPETP